MHASDLACCCLFLAHLAAGPKKHALELIRKKIEHANTAAVTTRRKRDEAKKVGIKGACI